MRRLTKQLLQRVSIGNGSNGSNGKKCLLGGTCFPTERQTEFFVCAKPGALHFHMSPSQDAFPCQVFPFCMHHMNYTSGSGSCLICRRCFPGSNMDSEDHNARNAQ